MYESELHQQAISLARIFHSPYTLLVFKTRGVWQFLPYFWSPVDSKTAGKR